MRVAVISDVHGNARALEAVLAALDEDPPDAIWSLGDTVGYGARPNECCALVADRAGVALAGNHDLVVAGVLGIEEFSHDAAAAARWSSEHLEESARAWLTGLEPHAEAEGLELFHGSPRDPVWEYVLSEYVALAALDATTAPAVLVGHSHVALAIGIARDGRSIVGGLAPAGSTVSFAEQRWLLNPGSVGQPRDGDPRAAYLVLDLDGRVAEFHRIDYDVAATQREIREAGLPAILADRLAVGE
jgi:diadenosine tetraphosphatase ApaH/serine/threonine PP2A family protein phosphatase